MDSFEKVKCWFEGNKKFIKIGGYVVLAIIGAGVSYVLNKDDEMTFSDWLQVASTDDLNEAYENLRLNFRETGKQTFEMEQISQELGSRGAEEWFEKHPPNLDPNYRWTDENRFE